MERSEILQLAQMEFISDVQQIELVQKYILDIKGQRVSIARPTDITKAILLNTAFNAALGYYLKDDKEEDGTGTKDDKEGSIL